jgi:hypothetical protein
MVSVTLVSCAAPRYDFFPSWWWSSPLVLGGCVIPSDPEEVAFAKALRQSAPADLVLRAERECERLLALLWMHIVQVSPMICQHNGSSVDISTNLSTPPGIALDVTSVALKNVIFVTGGLQTAPVDLPVQPFTQPFHVEPVPQQTPVIASVMPSSFPVQIVMDVYVMAGTDIVGIRGGRSCMVS